MAGLTYRTFGKYAYGKQAMGQRRIKGQWIGAWSDVKAAAKTERNAMTVMASNLT